jgi:hypothetical protein
MPSILFQILTHLGGIITTLKDIEQAIQDVVQGKASAADAQKVLQDLENLVSSSLISIPGVTSDQLAKIIADLQKAI